MFIRALSVSVPFFALIGCLQGFDSEKITTEITDNTQAFFAGLDEKLQSNDHAHACYQDICGNELLHKYKVDDEIFFLTDKEQARVESMRGIFDLTIEPAIRSYIKVELASDLELNKNLQKALLDSDIETVEREHAELGYKVVNVSTLFKMFRNETFYKFTQQQDGSFTLDQKHREGLSQEVIDSMEDKMTRANSLFHTVKSKKVWHAFTYIKRNGLEKGLALTYQDKSFSDALDELIAALEKAKATVGGAHPILQQSINNNYLLEKLKTQRFLVKSEIESLGAYATGLLVYESVIEGDLDEILIDDLSLENLGSVNLLVDFLDKEIPKYLDEEYVEQVTSDSVAFCKDTITKTLASSPKKEEIDAYSAIVDEVKSATIEVAKDLFGEDSQGYRDFLSRINKSYLIMPKTPEEKAIEIIDAFRLAEEQGRKYELNFAEVGEKVFSFVPVIIHSMRDMETEQKAITDSANSRCEDFLPEEMSDSVTRSDGGILVSRWSVSDLKQGIGRLAHEYGHLVYAEYKKVEASSKLRMCLSSRHQVEISSEHEDHSSEHRYEEEDFADHFTTLVMKKLGKTGKEYNRACSYFPLSKRTKTIHSFLSDVHALINQSPTDTHSSTFFRLVQNASDRGHLPQSCSAFGADKPSLAPEAAGVIPQIKACSAK